MPQNAPTHTLPVSNIKDEATLIRVKNQAFRSSCNVLTRCIATFALLGTGIYKEVTDPAHSKEFWLTICPLLALLLFGLHSPCNASTQARNKAT